MSRPEFSSSVRVQYLPDRSNPPDGPFAFAYTVTIRNTGDCTAQLVARQWLVTDAHGRTDEVRGLAVVGHQPLRGVRVQQLDPAFDAARQHARHLLLHDGRCTAIRGSGSRFRPGVAGVLALNRAPWGRAPAAVTLRP